MKTLIQRVTGTDLLKIGTLASAVFSGKKFIEAVITREPSALYTGTYFAFATMVGITLVSVIDYLKKKK